MTDALSFFHCDPFCSFKLIWRSPTVRASQMDFMSGLAEIEQDARDWDLDDEINKPRTLIGKFKRWWG